MHEACLDVVQARSLPGQGLDIFNATFFIANSAVNTPDRCQKHAANQVSPYFGAN
jgi:hypothetical protein